MSVEQITEIARRVRALGGRALLVGGCVRDTLLGLPNHDIDCEVYGLAPQTLHALAASFGDVNECGTDYGVYSLRGLGIDLAVPRTERRTGPLHGDFAVTLDPTLTPARAAARRDFTVNAIMRDVLTGECIDPYGGQQDLAAGILRAVPGGQFEEDPLRVLRGAQFAARFHLTPQADTLAAMRRLPLCGLSSARVMGELCKALACDAPDVFFSVLEDAGALSPWFAELEALRGCPQNPVYHPEGDALCHTLRVLQEAAAVRAQAVQPLPFLLAALTHDLGKAVSTKRDAQGRLSATGHEETGVPLVKAMLHRLSVPRETIAYAVNLCRLHMRVHSCYYQQAGAAATHRLFDAALCPQDLALLAVCDARGTGKPRADADAEEKFIGERLRAYQALTLPTGAQLMAAGAASGPALGKALAWARQQVLCGMDCAQAVEQAVQRIQSDSSREQIQA